ncbi:MAG: phenylalanine--tRNA ligase subunit beta [Thermotogota bacterium]
MRISKNWITDYIDLKINYKELVEQLKLHTADVEIMESFGDKLKNIIVGKIEKIKEHPNADKLIICEVNLGSETLDIVTGDLTVKENDLVPVAIDGAVLYDGFKIKARNFRGVKSNGMLCSLEEIGLEENSDAIYTITENVEPGTNFIEYFKIKDQIVSMDITPNKPDLLSYLGTAREFTAINAAENFKLPKHNKIETSDDSFPVKIKYDGCKRYTALKMKNIKIKQSPLWLVKKLAMAGIRSINNVVDITNYIMLETGHPVHAFDMKTVKNSIIVRKAEKGEKVELLDETQYELIGHETLITDEEKILALGGVMGGNISGINSSTKEILLEVAHFDPINIRKTTNHHKINTDSSYRFERGVDPNNAFFVMGRLTKLIEEYANGEIDGQATDIYPEKIENKKQPLRINYLNSKLGKNISITEIENILKRLNFAFERHNEGFEITIPTNRPDIEGEADLVEEIGRIYGYHNIESQAPESTFLKGSKSDNYNFKEKIASILRQQGYHETKNIPLMSKNKFWKSETNVKIVNPLSSELEYLIPELMYPILETASYNYRNQNKNIKMFEINKVFLEDKTSETGVKEPNHLVILATGEESPSDYTDKRKVSFYTLKGSLDYIFEENGINVEYKRAEIKGFSQAQTAEIYLNKEKIGFIGLMDPQTADKKYDIKDEIYLSEIDLDIIKNKSKIINKASKNYDYPAIKREYSFIVPLTTEFSEIENIIKSAGKIIEKLQIFDVYRGKGIDPEYSSITITIIYRSNEKTLTDEEVNKIEEKILKQLKNKNVKLREA